MLDKKAKNNSNPNYFWSRRCLPFASLSKPGVLFSPCSVVIVLDIDVILGTISAFFCVYKIRISTRAATVMWFAHEICFFSKVARNWVKEQGVSYSGKWRKCFASSKEAVFDLKKRLGAFSLLSSSSALLCCVNRVLLATCVELRRSVVAGLTVERRPSDARRDSWDVCTCSSLSCCCLTISVSLFCWRPKKRETVSFPFFAFRCFLVLNYPAVGKYVDVKNLDADVA